MGWCLLLRTAFAPLLGLSGVLILVLGGKKPALAFDLGNDLAEGRRARTWWRSTLVPLSRLANRRGAELAGVFVGVALLIPAPWFIRNCLFLGTFAPLGSQGGEVLSGAYCDEAAGLDGDFSQSGVWRVWNEYCAMHKSEVLSLSAGQWERRYLEVGRGAAREWIAGHTDSLPGMFVGRLKATWSRYLELRVIPRLQIILVLAFAALWLARDRQMALVLWSFLAANTALCVAVHPAHGRFQTPVDLLVVLLAGMSIDAIVQRLKRMMSSESAALSPAAEHSLDRRLVA
jgi:hypothetical protein